MERAIGTSLLFSAAINALEPLREGSLVDLMMTEVGMDPFVVSSWYLLGALYLLHKGRNITFGGFLLSIMPMAIIMTTSIYLGIVIADSSVTAKGSDIAREFMIATMVFQKMVSTLTLELINNVGPPDADLPESQG